jgi:single-stranded-DNA-specific exonuclease
VLDGEGWHRGVIGITASRVVERCNRPALVISREGDEGHGSGRSIPAFHLLQALESCPELFSRYGGHAHAVGFALPWANVAKLRQRLDQYARARLTTTDFEPQLECDRELPLSEVTPELHQALLLLEPFGMENPQPIFTARAVRLLGPPQTVKEKHVRLRLAPERTEQTKGWRDKITFSAMGWSLREACDRLQMLAGDTLDVAYSLGVNDHPEFGGLELTLHDIVRTKMSLGLES